MYFPDDENTAPYRARKDRKRYCGGHVGRKCIPIVGIVSSWIPSCRMTSYIYRGVEKKQWHCKHGLVCQKCGKILSYSKQGVCPEYKEWMENERSKRNSK